MKKLFLVLTLTSFVFAGPCCFCGNCKKNQTVTPSKPVPVSNVPLVFKNEPLVFRDKPVIASQPVNTQIEVPVKEDANEFDECVAECKANNVSSSVIDFCIRENCRRLK